MAPIRIGIIGLSSSAATSWASNAHLPYLLSPGGQSKYQIVALCNSSVDAAKRAIAHYKLPAETRAFGSPADIAADPDVQLVVCVTRVDKHYETIKPSIVAGKDVFVEWPLADNIERIRELAALAKEKNVQTTVGLQGRVAPPYLKIKEILESGQIGKVLSSELKAYGGTISRDVIPTGLKYFTERKVGGNPFTIGFGHLWDPTQVILGELQNIQANLQIQRPSVKVRDPASGNIIETIQSDVPDLFIVNGKLSGSAITKAGASASLYYRRGQPFKGEPAFRWSINGEKGELRLLSPAGPSLNASSYSQPVTIEVHDFETDEVTSEEWKWGSWQEELPLVARSIAVLYELFAAGDVSQYVTFDVALKRHEQLNSILEKFPPS